MSDVRFRRATPDDAEEILDIKRAAIEELEHWQYSTEQVQAWAPKDSYLETFEQAIADERFVVHVAEDDDAIIGYGALNVYDDRIDAVYVHPDHHGGGVATAMLKQLELSAEFQEISELDVMAARNAVPFYKSVGYWQLDDEVTTIEDVDLELVHMRKDLDSPDPDDWFETELGDEVPEEATEWFDTDVDVDPAEWFDGDDEDAATPGWFDAEAELED
jgi:N-acetylglutamate synthase-like GNAT family acetyltransferase